MSEQQRDYIREIQRYLLTIANDAQQIPRVAIDGIYGNETANAVGEFQKSQNMEVTNTVNEPTFNALLAEFLRINEKNAAPFPIKSADENAWQNIWIMQIMLTVISLEFSNLPKITLNGVEDEPTLTAIRIISKASGLNDNSTEKQRRNAVTLLYNNII